MVKIFRLVFSLTALVILAVWAVLQLGIFSEIQDGSRVGASPERSIRVLSYSSFTAAWAAGPAIAEEFFKRTGIRVELVDADESRLILLRLRKGKALPSETYDVVLGIDQFDLDRARQRADWLSVGNQAKGLPRNPAMTVDVTHPDFLPVDWAPLTFVARRGELAPLNSVRELERPEYKGQLVILDPRSSGPGYLFLLWLGSLYGEQLKERLNEFKTAVQIVSPSWSSGYGLFQRGQVGLVFSYMTSPVYHWIHENRNDYYPSELEEPLPFQVEYAGIPANCARCDDARRFLDHLASKSSQQLLMRKNFMLPVFADHREDPYFARLPSFKLKQVHENPTLISVFREVWK